MLAFFLRDVCGSGVNCNARDEPGPHKQAFGPYRESGHYRFVAMRPIRME